MAGQGKSGEKKTMRDILSAFLRMPAPESALEERALLLAQARGAPLDLYEAVVLTQIAKAMKGDTSAAAFVRDSAGDKPTEKAAAVPEAALSENDLALRRWRACRRGRQSRGPESAAPGPRRSRAGQRAARRARRRRRAGPQRGKAARKKRKFFWPKSHRMGDFEPQGSGARKAAGRVASGRRKAAPGWEPAFYIAVRAFFRVRTIKSCCPARYFSLAFAAAGCRARDSFSASYSFAAEGVLLR